MGGRARLVRLSMLMVEVTSLPLILLASIYLLSGYQMLNPEMKIIPEPRKIHADKSLRIISILLAYLHVLGGTTIVVERRLRKEKLRKTIETLLIAVTTMLLITFLAIETTL